MPARDHLVLVVPGIGGSVLARPGRPDEAVWSAGLRDVGDVLRRPERLSLEEHPVLEPVGLIRTRKLFGVWAAVRGYDGLLTKKLGGLPGAVVDDGTPAGRRLDATVVAVPYDFRQSIVDSARRLDDEIRQRLAFLWPKDPPGRARLVIVAHSLGGLVARYWAAQGENWRLCRSLTTLGTPHRGAPKALDVLANGVGAGRCRLRRPVPVLRVWPSMAELLPRYPVARDLSAPPRRDNGPTAALAEDGRRAAGAGPGGWLRPHEVPLAWLAEAATKAFAVHKEIENGWSAMPRDGGPEMVPRIGYGHGTLRDCVWDGQRLRVTRELADSGGLGSWLDDLGDGTVPAYCGLPLEMESHSPERLRVDLRHGSIVDLDEVVGIVQGYEGRPSYLPTRAGEERPVVLGLDIADVALAGEPFPVAARIRGTEADVGGVAVWATVTAAAADGAETVLWEKRLDHDTVTGTFAGEMPAPPPGVCRVRLSAREVPDGGDPRAEELVEVVDGDDVD